MNLWFRRLNHDCRREPDPVGGGGRRRVGGEEPYAHDSDEECVIVLKGRMHFWVGDEFYDLNEGDSLLFESRIPHRNRNPGVTKAEVLWIATPPSY